MAQEKIKTTIKAFEKMLEKKHKKEFTTGQIYRVENTVINRVGAATKRQKAWNYFLHANNTGSVATYYRDDRYGVLLT